MHIRRSNRMELSATLAAAALLFGGGAVTAPGANGAEPPARVRVVTDATPGAGARHGLKKLRAAFESAGVACRTDEQARPTAQEIEIVTGLSGGAGLAAKRETDLALATLDGREALRIRNGPNRLLVTGSDDRGLMYALLDVADRVGWAPDPARPLSEVRDTEERPYVPERALSKYTMHRAVFESFFHDEAYWERYLDMLARNRFNTFALLLGYEAHGFMAPPYPYFFDVPGFPDVRLVGLEKGDQQRNLASLNRLIKMVHDRGMDFTLGIWDHIYRGGVQGGRPTGKPTRGLVWGVSPGNLVPYTMAALRELVKVVPGIDAIQFRMHGESGLKREEMETFWPEVYRIMRDAGSGIRFDARAKNYPQHLIEKGVDMGVDLRMTTKYWAEQMGLPFHPTHIPPQNQHDRRHGYADMLRYPRRYKMHWRMWTAGTVRVFLWGDPEYVRRFAESTHLYDGDGYEVTEPMGTKMQTQPHDMPPFELLGPEYRYYDWEFERYWHFFQVFGRVGYNPETPSDVWDMEFRQRLGPEAGPLLERALHRASWILPMINATVFPYRESFPTTRGWPEKQRRGDLPRYATAGVSDTQQFETMSEAVDHFLEGTRSAKRHPLQVAHWFDATADDILGMAARAESAAGDKRGKELVSTLVDLRMLAHLARFHARRIPAGLAYGLFKKVKSVKALDDAITAEERAIEAWRGLVAAAGDVYTPDLMLGRRQSGLSGHWRDELTELEEGLAELRETRSAMPGGTEGDQPGLDDLLRAAPPRDDLPVIEHEAVREHRAGTPLRIAATVRSPAGIRWVRLRYRPVNQTLDYATLEMEHTGKGDAYEATVPAAEIDPTFDFMYLIEAVDRDDNGRIYPRFEEESPYVVVRLARDTQSGEKEKP